MEKYNNDLQIKLRNKLIDDEIGVLNELISDIEKDEQKINEIEKTEIETETETQIEEIGSFWENKKEEITNLFIDDYNKNKDYDYSKFVNFINNINKDYNLNVYDKDITSWLRKDYMMRYNEKKFNEMLADAEEIERVLLRIIQDYYSDIGTLIQEKKKEEILGSFWDNKKEEVIQLFIDDYNKNKDYDYSKLVKFINNINKNYNIKVYTTDFNIWLKKYAYYGKNEKSFNENIENFKNREKEKQEIFQDVLEKYYSKK